MNSLLEKHRQILILLLSVLIIAGSGVALGFGIAELPHSSPPRQTSGFVSGSENEPMNRLTNDPITGSININTAAAVELDLLPGIGPSKAAAVVNYRKEHGLFKTTAEIQNVPGIGPKIYAQIKDQITVK